MTTQVRNVILQGPPDQKGPLWQASLSVSHKGPGTRSYPDRTYGVRVLAQEATASTLPAQRSISGDVQTPKMEFHAPRLARLLVTGDDPGIHYVRLLGEQAAIALPDAKDAPGFSEVTASPLADGASWPHPHDAPLSPELPSFRLNDNRVRVLVLPGSSWYPEVSGGKARLFGSMPAPVHDGKHLRIDLLADAVEFSAEPPNPLFGFGSYQNDTDKTLTGARLSFKRLADGRLALELIGFDQADQASKSRAAFAALADSLEHRGNAAGAQPTPLQLRPDTTRAVPPLRWIVRQNAANGSFSIDDLGVVEIDPLALAPGLDFHLIDKPSAATFQAASATLTNTGAALRLEIKAGKGVPADLPRVNVEWTPTVMATRLQPPAGEKMRFSLDRLGIQEELGTRYRAAGVLGAEEGPAPYLYLPLQDGVLQLALPVNHPDDQRPLSPPKASADILNGTLLLRDAGSGSELAIETLQGLDIKVRWADPPRQLKEIQISCGGPGGRLSGVLWGLDSSPSAEEILPTLRAGPVATRDLALRFGGSDDSLLALFSEQWASDAEFRLQVRLPHDPARPSILWRGHRRLPLLSIADMTSSLPSARRPSMLRAWFPHRAIHENKPGIENLDLTCPRQDGGNPYALLNTEWPVWRGDADGWPFSTHDLSTQETACAQWPAAPAVDMFLPTVPDLMFTLGVGKDAALSLDRLSTVLCFELCALLGYFAEVTLPEPASPAESGPKPRPLTSLQAARLPAFWRQVAQRTALARTQSAFVTAWTDAGSAAGAPSIVSGLSVPHLWKAQFAFRPAADALNPPFGQYSLEDESGALVFKSGAETVAGLQRDIHIGSETLQVRGFAVAAVNKKQRMYDSRGGWIEAAARNALNAQGTLRMRAAGAEGGSAVQLTTLAQVLDISGPEGARFGFACTDLPMYELAKDRFVFSGVKRSAVADMVVCDCLESAPSADAAGFDPLAQPSASMRWRFFDAQPQSGLPLEFDVGIGPLRFKPLRLAWLEVAGGPGARSVTSVEILGRMRQSQLASSDGAFGTDGDYEAGNLMLMVCKPDQFGQLTVSRLRRVRVAATTPLTIEDSPAPLRFALDQNIFAPLEAQAGNGGVSTLELLIDPDQDLAASNVAIIGAAAICLPGLGLEHETLPGAVISRLPGRPHALRFKWGAQAAAGEGLGLTNLFLEWPAEQGGGAFGWTVQLRTAAPALAGLNGAPLGLSVRYICCKGSARMRIQGAWLGARLLKTVGGAHGPELRALLDPERSCLQLTAVCKLAQGELVQGLTLAGRPESAGVMALATLGTPKVRPPAGDLVTWPLLAVRCDVLSEWSIKVGNAEELHSFRHRLGKSGERWTSQLEVSGILHTGSSIAWPCAVAAASWPKQGYDPADGAGFVRNIDGGSRSISIGKQEVKRHTITLRLVRHVLPLDRLQYAGDQVRIVQPWTVLATVSHLLETGKEAQRRSLSWQSLDDVTLVDLQAAVERCGQERSALSNIAGMKDFGSGASPAADLPVTYAFGARFKSDTIADPGAPVHGMVQAGIGVRAYVNAGFPAWRMGDMLAKLKGSGGGLLITGGGVCRFELPGQNAQKQAALGQVWRDSTLTLAMPWLATPGLQSGQLSFNQDGGGVDWEVADADLAPAVPGSATLAAAAITLRPDDSEADIHAALRPVLAPGRSRDGGWRRASLTSVEQAFVREVDTKQPQPADATPFWLRTMVALDTLWDQLAPQANRKLALRPRGLIPSSSSLGQIAQVELSASERGAGPPATETLAVVLASGQQILDLRAGAPQGKPVAVALNTVYEHTNQPQAVMAALTQTGESAPFCNNWMIVDVARVDDFGAAAKPLRQFDDLVYASSALDWPSAAAVGDLADMALACGDESILQDERVAMSGQLQSYGIAAHAPGTQQARYWSFTERPVFERPQLPVPSIGSLLAPSALHLAPAPARQRSPSFMQTQAKLRAMAALPAVPIFSVMPPELAQLTLGLRPGAIYQRRAAGIMPVSDKEPPEAMYGTAAASGPALVQQGRSPRSTLLPDSNSPARRRRTIVAWDDSWNDGKADRPTPFRWLRGSAGVVRTQIAAEPVSSKLMPTGEVSYLVQVATPANGQLDAGWDRKITLSISSPTDATPASFFTNAGTEPPLLIIGPTAALLSGGSITQQTNNYALITYEVQNRDAEAFAAALASADGDTRAMVVLRYPGAEPPAAAPAAGPLVLPPLCLSLELALTIKPGGRLTAACGLATLVFSDPSYDRILRSATKSDGRRDNNGDVWLLAADRQVYSCGASVVFAFGRLNTGNGQFESGGGYYELSLLWIPAPRSGIQPEKQAVFINRESASNTCSTGTLDAAHSISLATLVDANGTPCQLAPDDLLSLSVTSNNVSRSIELRIVRGDLIPPAPAIFALVRVTATSKEKRADVPLFACAPLPQTVSYPSILADLAQGMVRRRAHFQWTHPQIMDSSKTLEAVLVKIDRTGGAQLPESTSDLRKLEGG